MLAGIYLAAKGPYDFSDFFVTFGLVVLVALLIMGGVFFGPNEAKAQALAERDLAAGGSLSDEYRAAAGKIAKVGAASGVAILLATLFMATHLGA